MPDVTKDLIYRIYDDFAQGRFDSLAEVIDDDIDFVSKAPAEVFPYLGRRRGRQEVIAGLAALHDELQVLSALPVTTLIDGDTAAITLVLELKNRITERVAIFLAAHFLRFRDGRVVEYRSIVDSLEAIRQMLGTRADFGDRA